MKKSLEDRAVNTIMRRKFRRIPGSYEGQAIAPSVGGSQQSAGAGAHGYFRKVLHSIRNMSNLNVPLSAIVKKESGHLVLLDQDNDEDATPLMNRIEDKYLLPRKHLAEITNKLRARLGQGDADTSARYNRNETIYMDNKDMVSFRDGLDRVRPRFKARIRRYAPNDGAKEDVAYVELKMKMDDGMTKKVRVRIPASQISKIADGGEITVNQRLMDENKDISKDKLWHRVATFNSIVNKYGLKKHLTVTYDRRAFANNKIRVTIDDKIHYKCHRDMEPEIRNSILKSKSWVGGIKQISKLATGEWPV